MMKHTKHLLVLWAALLLGAGNAWGYTGTFELVESNDVPTGYYVITASPSASTIKAMGTTISSGRATGQAVTISNKQIVNPADAIVWYIEKNADDTYSFKNVGDNNYIYQSSTTSGKGLAVSTSVPTIPWSINTYNSTSPIGFCFTSSKNSNNYLKWNNGSSWFSTYASGYTTSMTPVALYKLAGTPPTTLYLGQEMELFWNPARRFAVFGTPPVASLLVPFKRGQCFFLRAEAILLCGLPFLRGVPVGRRVWNFNFVRKTLRFLEPHPSLRSSSP